MLQKTRSGVSFVYFEINGTLVHFFQQAITRIALEHNVPEDVVESGYWHFNDEACRGTLSLDDFNRAMCERLGVATFDWRRYYLEAVEPIEPLQELDQMGQRALPCGHFDQCYDRLRLGHAGQR